MFNFFRRRRSAEKGMTDEEEPEEEVVAPLPLALPPPPAQQHSVEKKRVHWADMDLHQVDKDSSEEENDDEEEDEDEEEDVDETSKELLRLKTQMSDLDRDLHAKSALIDRLQTELRDAYLESEVTVEKLKKLELDLEEVYKKNTELEQKLLEQSDTESEEEIKNLNEERLKEANERIEQLEKELKEVLTDKESLEASARKYQAERDQEIRLIKTAFEEALSEQDEVINKFEKEFEDLRTLNANREQQLLEDFEWKLREVEKACKKRIQDRDKERERDWAELASKLAAAELEIQQIPKLKVVAAEFEQTKASNMELKRNMRAMTRRLEEIQVNEKVLQEETNRLRSVLDKEKSYAVNLQIVHREELDERERKQNFKLQVQKNQINSEWEDKMKRESAKIKSELEKNFKEEKIQAVQQTKATKDSEFREKKKLWDDETKEHLKKIEDLENKLIEKDEELKLCLEEAQTKSDQDILELRRKMDKLYMSYEEKIEKLQESHDQDMNKIQEDCDKKVQQCEANLQMQVGTTRTTVELVKEQLHRETELRIRQLEHQNQERMEEQWARLTKEKDDAIKSLEERHRGEIKQLNMEMNAMSKCIDKEERGKQIPQVLPEKESSLEDKGGTQEPTREEPVNPDSQNNITHSFNNSKLESTGQGILKHLPCDLGKLSNEEGNSENLNKVQGKIEDLKNPPSNVQQLAERHSAKSQSQENKSIFSLFFKSILPNELTSDKCGSNVEKNFFKKQNQKDLNSDDQLKINKSVNSSSTQIHSRAQETIVSKSPDLSLKYFVPERVKAHEMAAKSEVTGKPLANRGKSNEPQSSNQTQNTRQQLNRKSRRSRKRRH